MRHKIDGGVISLPVPFIHVLEASQECMLDRLVFTLHAQGLQVVWSFSSNGKTLLHVENFTPERSPCVDARTLRQLCASLIICHSGLVSLYSNYSLLQARGGMSGSSPVRAQKQSMA